MTVGCCCANTRCWAAPATLPLTLPSRLHCPPPACQYHHRRRPPVRRRYEKARKLKEHIGAIRSTYEKNWDARDRAERQVSPPPTASRPVMSAATSKKLSNSQPETLSASGRRMGWTGQGESGSTSM